MIGSLALFATLVAAPPAEPPRPHALDRDWPRELHLPEMPDLHFDLHGFEMPELDDLDADFDLRGLRALALRDPDQEEADEDEDAGEADRQRSEQQRERDRQRRDADRQRREQDQQRRDQERERRDQERERRAEERDRLRSRLHGEDRQPDEQPSARAAGKNGTAALAVKGPVTFRLRVQSGEVEVVPSDQPQIAVSVDGVPAAGEVQLLQYGDRVEAEFSGRRQLRRGRLRVEVPKGSTLDFDSTSGDLSVHGVGGDVRVRTMSGDVKIEGARNADVESVSGDVALKATGPRQSLHIVSGNALVTTVDPSVQLAFQSASGSLDWTGVCAKGCHLSTETVSGEIKLQPDASKSSFELSYASHSGDLRDELKLEVKRAPKRKHGGMGGWLEAVYGKGEGVIECDAFSGDLIVRKK